MYMKICHKCKRKSYSSSELCEWKCPSCATNISMQKFHASTNHINQNPLPKKKKLVISIVKSRIDVVV